MRTLILFAHFDTEQSLRSWARFHLSQLRSSATRLVFISNSGLRDSDQDWARECCDEILTRENIGLDFGMWQAALLLEKGGNWDRILLVNSSMIGPFYPIPTLLDHGTRLGCDFWGLTDSIDQAWHLQSYFLMFERTALDSAVFWEFWEHLIPFRSKPQTIRSYEVGLSVWLQQNLLRGGALFPEDQVRASTPDGARRRLGLNCSARCPEVLLDLGFPYLKIEAIRSNPGKVSLSELRKQVLNTGYDLSLLMDDPRLASFLHRNP